LAINSGSAGNGLPGAIINVIEQQGYLERLLRKSLRAKRVLRAAAATRSMEYFDARIGESKTFTRAGAITPSTTALNPANNTGLDNGLTPVSRGFEQWTSYLNEWAGAINLNVLGNETLLGDLYEDDMVELAEAAETSLENVCWLRAMAAYDSGDSFALAAVAAAASVHVDNINGFSTAYATANAPSLGLPQPVSTSNKLAILVISGSSGAVIGSANVQGATADGTNISYMQTGATAYGVSGVLALDAAITCAQGDRIVAMDPNNPSTTVFNPTYKDGSYVIRPLNSGVMVQDAFKMTAANVVAPSIQIPQMVALLSRRQIPRLSNGLYGVAIDATLLGSFYSDNGFQIATQGTFDRSPVFANGIIAKGWGVEFVECSQVPVYQAPAGGFALRHAFAFGADVVSEHPFIGSKNAQTVAARAGDITDSRWIDRIRMITQAPLDRANEVVKMTYKYVGDFQPGTDKASNPFIINTSDFARYKRGVLLQAAAAF
jgi:hypothetical protein